ncbi:MAG: NAD(P)H-dependent oxidoreductase subunit E, partial [Ignavibacteria bacterium]
MEYSQGGLGGPLSSIIERNGRDPTRLLQILVQAQQLTDWISPDVVALVAGQLKLPPARIQSVAEFYSFLYTRPRGKYRILFSDNITDRMLGSIALLEHMGKRLKIKPGQVSDDGLVSIDLTSCTGMCDQGPAILVNNCAITRMTPRRVDEICDLIRGRVPLADWPDQYFKVEDNVRRADILLGSIWTPGDGLRAAIERGPQGMLAELKRSNLRGRGGA